MWDKMKQIIQDHKTIYSRLLDHKSAIEIQFLHSGKNDYDKILSNKNDFKIQSFKWTGKDDECTISNEDFRGNQNEAPEENSDFDSELEEESKAQSDQQLKQSENDDFENLFKSNLELNSTRESTYKGARNNVKNDIFSPDDIESYFNDKEEDNQKSRDEASLFDSIRTEPDNNTDNNQQIPRN